MVGESKDSSILKTKKDSSKKPGKEQGSYSRRKKDKKAKFQGEMNGYDEFENRQLVDRFIQEVIERAKNEYLKEQEGQAAAIAEGPLTRVEGRDVEDTSSTKDHLLKEAKSSEDGSKGKHCKRRHNYKYSAPVDAKEISEYEAQEANTLLMNERRNDPGEATQTSPSFYHRSAATIRRLLSCCIGKT